MTKKRCAYLTMECTDGWTIDAELGFADAFDHYVTRKAGEMLQ